MLRPGLGRLAGVLASLLLVTAAVFGVPRGKGAKESAGSLKGKATLDGELPKPKSLVPVINGLVKVDPKQAHCLGGPAEDLVSPVWKVRKKDKAVANVVAWLRPAAGQRFRMPPAKKTWPDVVTVDQPYCAFVPHVVVLFPAYYDPVQDIMVPTGQKFKIKNSAPIAHNVAIRGTRRLNPFKNYALGGAETGKAVEAAVQINPDTVPLTLGCDIHKWMSAKVWAFDHPYAAVTGKDGTYEIKNVPAGVKVRVVAWHEAAGFITPNTGVQKIFSRKEVNVMSFRIKRK
jgi:hypothetical protein